MTIHTKCELVVKEEKNHGRVPLRMLRGHKKEVRGSRVNPIVMTRDRIFWGAHIVLESMGGSTSMTDRHSCGSSSWTVWYYSIIMLANIRIAF